MLDEGAVTGRDSLRPRCRRQGQSQYEARRRPRIKAPTKRATPDLGRPAPAELLELTILIAEREPHRHARIAARWLLRYLEVRDRATIDDAALVTSCLVALGGDRHLEAATALRAIAKTATTSNRTVRAVP